MSTRSDRGAALVVAMMAVLIMTALGASLAILSNTELKIAANYVDALELRYAAEAALEAVVQELTASADWAGLLAGPALSLFIDGSPGGRRALSDGSSIDLDDLTSQAITDNPSSRLYAFAPLQRLQPGGPLGVDGYVVVWIADDPQQDPAILAVRSEAFGASGMRRMLEAQILRTEADTVRVVSWQELR